MKKIAFIISALFLFTNSIIAQKPITLEDVWSKGTFSAKTAPGFNFMKDGRHYTLQDDNTLSAQMSRKSYFLQIWNRCTAILSKATFGYMTDRANHFSRFSTKGKLVLLFLIRKGQKWLSYLKTTCISKT